MVDPTAPAPFRRRGHSVLLYQVWLRLQMAQPHATACIVQVGTMRTSSCVLEWCKQVMCTSAVLGHALVACSTVQ